MNDLPTNIDQGRGFLYADDTAIAISDQRPHMIKWKLNTSLNTLATWFAKNKLSLNLKKCKSMLFGTSNQLSNLGQLTISYGEEAFEQVQSFKYLGVVLDSRLTFSEHVHILDQGTALMLYKTLILPIYDYCDYVYYSVNQNDRKVLQRLKNCALRTILRVERLTSTMSTHNTLCMDTLDTRRNKHVAVQMYRFTHNLASSYCCDMYQKGNKARSGK